MANETTETTTQPTTTAPVAEKTAVETKPAAASAPQTTTEKPQTSGETKTPLKPSDFFRQREEKREKKAQERLPELEKKLADYERKLAELEKSKPATEAAPPSFLEDPEGTLRRTKEEAKQEAVKEIEGRLQREREEYQYRQASEKAAEWLLTRSHLKEDRALLSEIADAIENKYQRVSIVDPSAAAELAYLSVCKAKGITPDIDGLVSAGFDQTKGKAAGGKGPSPAAEGERVFTKQEAEQYVFKHKPGSKEFRAALKEMEQAKSEGRIR